MTEMPTYNYEEARNTMLTKFKVVLLSHQPKKSIN